MRQASATKKKKPVKQRACCALCENELDLHVWPDGNTYCAGCLLCPHDAWPLAACVLCLRDRHTMPTLEGLRIRDVELYLLEAMVEYGMRPWELLTWTYEEQHLLSSMAADLPLHNISEVRVLPPHLRTDQ